MLSKAKGIILDIKYFFISRKKILNKNLIKQKLFLRLIKR